MDREKVIAGLEELYGFLFREYANIPAEESKIYYERTCAIRGAIALLKEQEAIQTKTGHWIDTTNTIGFPRCECSECNSEAGAIWMKYCPNCGAKMEGR